MSTVSTYLLAATGSEYPVEALSWEASVTANANDVVQGPAVKAGWKIISVTLTFESTNDSSLITATVGDGNVAARFISSTETHVGGSVGINAAPTLTSGSVATGFGYVYAVDDTIDITFSTNNVIGQKYAMIVKYIRTY